MNESHQKLDHLKKVAYFREYRDLAEKGNFSEALGLNQKSYEFLYEMCIKEKDAKFKAKIQKALEIIANDGQFIQNQLNIQEES